jgi:hypothetical protein
MRIPALLLLCCTVPFAQNRFEFLPGTAYDPALPTMQKVLGSDFGERITSHSNLLKYLEALAAAAPSRMKVFDYGKTWERRRLVYAVVGSEANIRRLDEIKAAIGRLADPRKTPEPEARKIMASLPAVVWLGYGVHGNEISSPDAGLLAAYHLLAARNDKLTAGILGKALIIIDPSQNPDGRDRFVHHYELNEGLEPDASPVAAEHVETWHSGRTNHYIFDLNRDWFALTQPETRARIRMFQEWFPLVAVDLHEMGAESTYFFGPGANPWNPHLTKEQKEAVDWFGRNNARWFDKFGFSYFTREVFDEFYPGYGASWPQYYGAVAMTYENASSRGLAWRRNDDSTFTFRDTVHRHFLGSISTLETVAQYREKLLENFYRYRASAVEDGSKEPAKAYVLPRRGDVSAVDKLAATLGYQGVEVKRSAGGFDSFPAGSYVVSLAQPSKRLIRVLLDAQVPMDDAFVKEQERRRKKKLPDEIYDVTGWSLPLLYNVECVALQKSVEGPLEDLPAGLPPARRTLASSQLAYLAPWGTRASAELLAAALRSGIRVHTSDKEFTQNGRRFPRGTLIFKVSENVPGLHQKLETLVPAAEIVPTSSGWVEDGVNFGSRHVTLLKRPRVACAWDTPASSSSAGHTRFVLERQFGYPLTTVRTQTLATADLAKFEVIILPDTLSAAAYSTVLGENGVRRLREWVTLGGTLIAIKGAVSFLADPKVKMLAVSSESLAKPLETPSKESKSAPETPVTGKILSTEEDFRKAIEPETAPPDSVPGVLLRAVTDKDHWITAGVSETLHVLVQGRSIYTPIRLDKGVNAAYFVSADKILASGHLWEENRKQLAFKPLLVVQREGRGHLIGFTADPNFRAFVDGMNILFMNAVFRGPAQSR